MAAPRLCFLCSKNIPQEGPLCESCILEYPLCFECGQRKRNMPYKLCSQCYSKSGNRQKTVVPLLQRLDEKKSEYKEAHVMFKSRWVKGNVVPEPVAIFAISNPDRTSCFDKYARKLRREDADATTSQHFHGTTLLCDILNNNSSCGDSECGVCGIAVNGFDPSRIGSNIPRFMRFGRGFYLAPNSSKCHDYTKGIQEYGVRAQLLCLVASGTRFKTLQNQTHLRNAPGEHHSVFGEGGAGGTLNYDEITVYDRDAILPQFVIVYKHNGVDQIAK